MVLFDFDTIISDRYKFLKSNNPAKLNSLDLIQFKQKGIEQITKIFPFYFGNINQIYLTNVLSNNKTKIILSCIDNKFDLNNITSILIYHKTKLLHLTKFYILALGTHERFRKFGYGKIILDEFVQWIKQTNKSVGQKKIILKSLETSMGFYNTYGFVLTDLKLNKLFYKYETNLELKNNPEKILEYVVE